MSMVENLYLDQNVENFQLTRQYIKGQYDFRKEIGYHFVSEANNSYPIDP